MEYLKNIGGEIARSLDSDQAKQGQSSNKISSGQSENAETDIEKGFDSTVNTPSKPETDWGKWEDVKATPTTTSTSTNKTSGSRTDTKHEGNMAAHATTPPGPSVTPTKSKIDNLSREELLERVKKQTVLLQRMKARSEELTKECNKLKTKATTAENQTNIPSNNEALMQEMQALKNERDQLLTEVKSVKQIISSVTKDSEEKINGLEAEKIALQTSLECRKDEYQHELDSLRYELKSVQEKLVACSTKRDGLLDERERLLKENEGLKEQIDSNESGLQETVEQFRVEKEELCRNNESLLQQLNESREGFEKDKQELLDNKNEVEQLMKERLNKTQEQLKTVGHKLDQNVSETEQLKTDYEALKSSYKISKQERLKVEKKLDELKDKLLTVKNSENTLQQKLAEFESDQQVLDQVPHQISEEHVAGKKGRGIAEGEHEEVKKQLIRIQKEKQMLLQEKEEVKMKYEKDRNQLLEEIQGHQEKIVSLTESLNNLESQESSVMEENNKIKAEIKELQRANSEEVKKLKSIAVKLKKELGEAKGKEASLKEESRKYTEEGSEMKLKYDKLKEEMDRVMEELQSCREQLGTDQAKQIEDKDKIQSLEDQLSNEISKKDKLTEEHAQRKATLEEENKQLKEECESIRSNFVSVTQDLQKSKLEIEQYIAEIGSLNKELSNERESHSETQRKLATVEKEMKSSSLIDLELADYQRSVEGLKKELEEKKVAISKLEEKLVLASSHREQVQREKDDIQSEINAKDEMTNKLKAMLRKATKDLSDAKAQISEWEIAIGKCEGELEKARLEKEEAKMEIATLTAKMQADINEHQSSTSHQSQVIHSLESKVTKLHSQSLQLQEEMKKAKEEHESYKVRVHSVLKQKSTTPSVDEIESGLRQKHELDVLKIKAELKEAKDQLTQALAEHEELEIEHHQLSSRHEQLLLDNQSEKQQLNNKLFDLETKYRSKSREYEDVISGLKRDIVENTRAFNRQLLEIQETHSNELTKVRNELKTTTAQLDKLQQEADSLVLAKKTMTTTNTTHKSQISRESSTPVNELIIIPSEERSAGEGMDVDELKNTEVHKKDEPNQLSLERLLSTSSSDLPRVYSPSVSDEAVDVTVLQQQVRATQEKIGHLRELLYESEDNCVRLTDQAKLLKEEIRRLERNNERLREASNMEYMKNVVLKFLHDDSANERAGLVPVIAKLLQLSQQEVKYLSETIEGNNVPLPDPSGVNPSGGGGASRWGSYLHRWTGY